MSALLALVSAFAQVGICAFGGGLSTLPLIEYQLVVRTGWVTTEQFAQILALSQVTPGPIAVNAATFVGYQQAGPLGALIATTTIVATPLIILCIVLAILKQTSEEKSKTFKKLLRPIVAGLLSLSLISPLTSTIANGYKAVLLFVTGLALLKFVKFFKEHPPVMLFFFGIIGIFFL
ncbi:MAG: chromate transporter [Synergistaceae bacterium]